MWVDIREDQARDLLDVLGYHLKELLQQIDHADDRAFRQDLRERFDRLDAFRQRLELLVRNEPEIPLAPPE